MIPICADQTIVQSCLVSKLPNAPAKLRALSEKEASRQLQPVVRWRLGKLTIGRFCERRQYFYFPYFLHCRGMDNVIEIPCKLQVKPKLRFHPKQLFQTESSIWRHATLPWINS